MEDCIEYKYVTTASLINEPAILDIRYDSLRSAMISNSIYENADLRAGNTNIYARVILRLADDNKSRYLHKVDYIWLYDGVKVLSLERKDKGDKQFGRSLVVDVQDLLERWNKKRKSLSYYIFNFMRKFL